MKLWHSVILLLNCVEVKLFLKLSTFLFYWCFVDGLWHIQMENMEDSRKETGNDLGPSFVQFIALGSFMRLG